MALQARCPVHAAAMPCDGEHDSYRAARILRMHAQDDHSYCATLARCDDRQPEWVRRAQSGTLVSKDMTRG